MVSFFDNVRITLNYGNCWNVWIAYRSYAIKWSCFNYIVFKLTNFLIMLIFLIMIGLPLWWYFCIKFFAFTKTRIYVIFCTFWRRLESTSQLVCVLVCQFIVSFPTSELCYKCFPYNETLFMTLGPRSFVVRCITYGNNVWNNVWEWRFVFVRQCDVFFISSQLRYLFVPCSSTFSDDVRITLYFGTFELRMEIMLQLRFVFVRHCNVFLITSQLRYLFVRCSYVFWWR